MNYRFVLSSILAVILFNSCQRSGNSPSHNHSASSELSGTWYFGRMEGKGYPFSMITFLNDSILLGDTERLHYHIKHDSITIDFVSQENNIEPLTQQFKAVGDSLVIINQNGQQYYCRTQFAWENNKLSTQIVGIWSEDFYDDENGNHAHEEILEIQKGVIQYDDSMYSERASFNRNILTILNNDGSQSLDTIVMPSIDTLVVHSAHAVDTMIRWEADA